jgi:type II secretory pathway pseudopilin PulG
MRRRQAFTLVEMLVAMALIIFIMTILSEAFVQGLETFRQLKAIGDMQERLRAVTTVLRRDLQSEHFDGRRRLSDPDFWNQGPPREGFFRIWQGLAPGLPPPLNTGRINEGTDADGLPSFRANDHALHYTIRNRGNRREDFFSAQINNLGLPGNGALFSQTNFFDNGLDQPAASRFLDFNTYTSPWAEAAVFLRWNGTFTSGPTGNVRLYGLYRRVLLAVPDNRHVNWETSAAAGAQTPVVVNSLNTTLPQLAQYLTAPNCPFAEISCKKRTPDYTSNGAFPDTLYFNNPTDLTIPERRFGMYQGDYPDNTTNPPRAVAYGGQPLRLLLNLDQDGGRYPIYGDVGPNAAPLLTQAATQLVGGGVYSPLQGADLLLNDVISMDISVLLPGQIDFISLFDPVLDEGPNRLNARANSKFYRPRNAPTTNLASPAVFDTWSWQKNDLYDYSSWDPDAGPAATISAVSVPLKIRIIAIKIVLRVWDLKTQQTRQVTLIQDM